MQLSGHGGVGLELSSIHIRGCVPDGEMYRGNGLSRCVARREVRCDVEIVRSMVGNVVVMDDTKSKKR